MTPATTKRVLSLLALIVVALYTRWLAKPGELAASPTPWSAISSVSDGSVKVARVIDGDTIELEGGAKVRYIGVNTPETVDPRRAVQCFGHEASDFNKKLLAGGMVRLVKDISDKDKYDRLLRYVYLPDGTFVNLKLVADGYANVNTYPPDIAHAREFTAAQAAARSAGRGLWGSCPAK